ncbi:MAG: hypothetical protein NC342_03240 [Pseudoflavonifractor sp.]|nr:hypothetical protein [Alloprevotella sp.]MCM1116529.1 hypothetical protein [Pseudoflavonifractor sp.]
MTLHTLLQPFAHTKGLMSAALMLLTLLLSIPASADVINVDDMKRWQKKLAEARNPKDSVTILFNLFDISLRNDAGVYSEPLIHIASRVMDYDTELDVIRKVINKNDTNTILVDSLKRLVERVPVSDNQRETLIFIEVRKLLGDLSTMNETERVKVLHRLIEEYEDDPTKGLYERILPLYKLTMALGMTVGGDLYSDYMDRLSVLVRQLPGDNGPLTSLYATQASLIYTIMGDHGKAVEANRQYLQIVDELKSRSLQQGHIFASYKNNEYLALRRMLVNYQALSEEEVDSVYSRMCRLTENDPELSQEFRHVLRAKSYYLVAKKRYPEAIVAIREALKNEGNRNYKLQMLKMLIESAEATGDRTILAEARTEYIASLENSLNAKRTDKIRELQLLLDVNATSQERLDDVKKALQESDAHYRLVITVIVTVAIFLLAVLAILFFLLVSRQRALLTKAQTQ